MRWVIDAQLPPALAVILRKAGLDAVHVQDLGLRDAPDTEIWRYTLGADSVLVTKDGNFADWALVRNPAPRIAWLRIGNVTKANLLEWLDKRLPVLIQRLEQGERIVEIR
jgi:predicted nuclease of predicted toxin-antitoxin system